MYNGAKAPDVWLRDAQDLLPGAIELRRRLHRKPEIGLRLPQTVRSVREALGGLDIDIAQGPSSSGMVVTVTGTHGGRTILLRADMDALPMQEDTGLHYSSEVPGCMHACGHDAHTAMLTMVAVLLHRHRDRLHGTVKLMFEAGEEGYFGARHMINDGLLDRAPAPDAAFAIHVSPNIGAGVIAMRAGPLLAAMDPIAIAIKGRGGHASMPHLACDPIPIACEIATALQTHVARRVNPFDPAILSITMISAGSADNVIPESVRMAGTLRTMSEKTRAEVKSAILRLSTKIAEAHEAESEVTLGEGYPVTVNDSGFTALARSAALEVFGPARYLELPAPIMAAEDFSYVLQRIPGCMAFLGVAPPGVTPERAHGCHSNRMILNEEVMSSGIALYASIAAKYLENTGI